MLQKEKRQREFFDDFIGRLVPKNHNYRKLKQLIDFEKLLKPIEETYSKKGRPSEPLTRGFKGLLLQFWQDLSDRELMNYLQDSNSAKWFCGYRIDEEVPTHSYFNKLRGRIGTDRLTPDFRNGTP